MSTYSSTDDLNKKFLLLAILPVAIALLILVNGFRIQLVEGQANLALSTGTNRLSELVRAPRGLIYDKQGRALVANEAAFNVYALPSQLASAGKLDEVFAKLEPLVDVPQAELKARFERSAYNSKGQLVGERVTLVTGLDYDKFLESSSSLQQIAGIYIANEAKRTYKNSENMANILGYMGDINAEEMTLRPELDPRARVGKDGIERLFDAQLRGEDGLKLTERSLSADRSWVPRNYKPGDNVALTIDIDWQNNLHNYLAKYSDETGALGAAGVILEADSGKVIAMANHPTYDINMFARGISSAEFNTLLADDRTPLLNRAISMPIPTGSVFKVVMATALLEEGAVQSSSRYNSGCFELPGGYKLCEADNRNYGNLDLIQAIARSSNPYFCQATVALARKTGSDQAAIRKLNEYFTAFKLGSRSGISLPGEQPGLMPTPELKQSLQGENWFLADLCNTAIGQGLVSATPLQMAVVAAAIDNGGKVYKPQIIDHLQNELLEKSVVEPEVVSQLPASQKTLDIVRQGMRAAVDTGTAKGLAGLPGDIIAKTGSSEAVVRTQSGRTIDGAHSWVIGSFEHGGKRYAFAVALQFGGRGFRSVPVMGEFIKCLNKDFQGCLV